MNEHDSNAAPMSMASALRTAICGDEIDFFPRELGEKGSALIPTPEVMRRFGEASGQWSFDGGGADMTQALALARQSLDEVKEQTEYQDLKATRLLTVTTFLTAFAGAVFLRFSDAFPLTRISQRLDAFSFVTAVSYTLFGLFIIFSVCGALITFHATRTRFKYEPGKLVAKSEGNPRSRIFFREISSVTPEVWSNAFVAGPRSEKVGPDLASDYLRDLVGETYLVACKTADKLRLLDPAQRFLAAALRCLLLWIISIAIVALTSGLSVQSKTSKPQTAREASSVVAPTAVPAAREPPTPPKTTTVEVEAEAKGLSDEE